MLRASYLTTTEVAKRWRVHRRVVLHWIRSGQLPAANFSPPGTQTRWKVRRGDLEKFEMSRKNGVVVEKKVRRKSPEIVCRF